MKKLSLAILLLSACGGIDTSGEAQTADDLVGPSHACDTGQIFATGDHEGRICAPITGSMGVVAQVQMDPSAQSEHDDLGFLAVHYAQALTSGAWVYTETKSGYTDPVDKQTQTWGIQASKWIGGALVPQWTYASAWQPVDAINPAGTTNFYESLFQPALTAQGLFVPSSAGTIVKLDPTTGAVISTINPFTGTAFDGDQDTIVNSAIAADQLGNLYYSVTAWPTGARLGAAVRGSWGVRVASSGATLIKAWADLAPASIGIKQVLDPSCVYAYSVFDPTGALRPYPPTPGSAPDTSSCGGQRPSTNVAPAITHDGHVLWISTENNAINLTYLVATDAATLAPAWATEMRDIAFDDCGIHTPYGTGPDDCRAGTAIGVDPSTNLFPAAHETGIMEASPMVAPDGGIYVGSYTGSYDNNQGHLARYSPTGSRLETYDYGWESTPSVFTSPAHTTGPLSFALVMDENRFSPESGDGTGPGLDARTVRLSPDFHTQITTHASIRSGVEANDYLDGQAAVDDQGNVYVLNASGTIYKISPSGVVLDSVELGFSMETLSVEMSWGKDGLGNTVLFVPYAGTMYVIGTGGTLLPRQDRAASSRASRQSAKHRGTER